MNRPRKRPRPRTRSVPGTMNKLEARYEVEVLKPMLMAGEIADYLFEAVKLRLADRTFYTPDFVVITPEQIEFHEVKGFWEDDARVKIKVAAAQFWWARFVAIQWVKKQWKEEVIG
jgi:hypothetical protein